MANLSPVFLDNNDEYKFRTEGFLVKACINTEVVEQIKNVIEEVSVLTSVDDVHIKTDYLLSTFNNGYEYKEQLYERIYALIQESLDALLLDYVPIMINVFDKRGDKSGHVPVHQNPSFAEEPEYKSVSVWVPLVHVTKDNGSVGVLRGSQDKLFPQRAPNMPQVFSAVEETLASEYFEALDLSPGEVAVLDDSLIHWSYPNKSDERRLALQVICVPAKAPHVYYYHDKQKNVIEKYLVSKEFFYRFNCHEKPEGLTYISSRPADYHEVSLKELNALLNIKHETKAEGIFQRLKSMLTLG